MARPFVLPASLAVLFDAHRPVGPHDLYVAWAERAASIGLHPGDVADVRRVAFEQLVNESGPYRRADAMLLLEALEGLSRRRRGRYRLLETPGQPPAIVADPDGRVDNLAGVLPRFRAAATDQRQRHVLASADGSQVGLSALARRFAVSVRSLQAWRARRVQKSPACCTCVPRKRPDHKAA